MIVLRTNPPEQRGKGRWVWSGGIETDRWNINARIEAAQKISPGRVVASTGREVVIEGFWDSFAKAVNHPASNAVLAAVSMIPGAGQIAAPALAAARAVAVIGQDLTAQKIAELHKRKQLALAAKAAAVMANKAMEQQKLNVRVSEADMQRALLARVVPAASAQQTIKRLAKAPMGIGSAEHRNLIALYAAQAAKNLAPNIKLVAAEEPAAAYEHLPDDVEDKIWLEAS